MTLKRIAMKEIKTQINEFLDDTRYDSLLLHTVGSLEASRLRAAVSMHRLRNNLDFTTSVDGDMVWIFKIQGLRGNTKEMRVFQPAS